mgnify:CR=1 FL=1
MKKHIPKIVTRKSKKDYDNRSGIRHLQIADRTNYDSLDLFKAGYLGQIHKIWARIPVSLLEKGQRIGWRKITKQCKEVITGKASNKIKKGVEIKFAGVVKDGFTIDGFNKDRNCDFDDHEK